MYKRVYSNTRREKSKFLAFLVPYKDFDKKNAKIKDRNIQRLVYFVYAYRYLNEFEQIVENSSDDGNHEEQVEKPTLAVLVVRVL